mgnify:CR=1 FL=1
MTIMSVMNIYGNFYKDLNEPLRDKIFVGNYYKGDGDSNCKGDGDIKCKVTVTLM